MIVGIGHEQDEVRACCDVCDPSERLQAFRDVQDECRPARYHTLHLCERRGAKQRRRALTVNCKGSTAFPLLYCVIWYGLRPEN